MPSWIRVDGKLGIIQQVWGSRMPSQLWYYLGFLSRVDKLAIHEVAFQVFRQPVALQPDQGLAIVNSHFLAGGPLVLRVYRPDAQLLPLEVSFGKLVCPLYVVSADGQPGYINFAEPEMSEGSTPVEDTLG